MYILIMLSGYTGNIVNLDGHVCATLKLYLVDAGEKAEGKDNLLWYLLNGFAALKV